MATTSRGITLADANTVVNPIQAPLNALANDVNDALDDLEAGIEQNYFIGTNAERAALTAPALRNGVMWYATDTNIVWEYRKGVWAPRSPVAMAAGISTVGVDFPTISLPAGRFTQPPIITAQVLSGAGGDTGIGAMVTQITTTNFKLRHAGGGTGTRQVMWIAIQMTPTSAAG